MPPCEQKNPEGVVERRGIRGPCRGGSNSHEESLFATLCEVVIASAFSWDSIAKGGACETILFFTADEEHGHGKISLFLFQVRVALKIVALVNSRENDKAD